MFFKSRCRSGTDYLNTATRGRRYLFAFSLLLSATSLLAEEPSYITREKDWVLDTILPSVLPPDGLEVSEIPQFVVIGSDDNTLVEGLDWYSELLRTRVNPTTDNPNPGTFDGHAVNASFYVIGDALNNDTITDIFKDLYSRGYDIGNHSYNHVGSVEIDHEKVLQHRTVEEYTKEIVDCNNLLIENVGMDPKDIVGFRTPMLKYSDTVLTVLDQQNFLYDCSIYSGHESWEGIGEPGTYFWPYTLEKGSPSCNENNHYTKQYDLPVGEHKGLWELPVHMYQIIPDSLCEEYGIDRGLKARIDAALGYTRNWKVDGVDYNFWAQFKLTKEECLAIMKYSFDLTYEGNRAPFHYLIHSDFYSDTEEYSTWFPTVTNEERRAIVQEFIDYALTKQDVRIISSAQLIDWMRNPVKLSTQGSSITNEDILKKAIAVRSNSQGVIQLSTEVAGSYSVKITTVQGRVILDEARRFDQGINTVSLSKSSLGKSIYFLSLTTPEGVVYNSKLSFK